MKTISLMGLLLVALTTFSLADDLPPIPKTLKGCHYASDTNVTVEVKNAMLATERYLKEHGEKELDGESGRGVIYLVVKNESEYWVYYTRYHFDKKIGSFGAEKVSPVVILDADFKFKRVVAGA